MLHVSPVLPGTRNAGRVNSNERSIDWAGEFVEILLTPAWKDAPVPYRNPVPCPEIVAPADPPACAPYQSGQVKEGRSESVLNSATH